MIGEPWEWSCTRIASWAFGGSTSRPLPLDDPVVPYRTARVETPAGWIRRPLAE